MARRGVVGTQGPPCPFAGCPGRTAAGGVPSGLVKDTATGPSFRCDVCERVFGPAPDKCLKGLRRIHRPIILPAILDTYYTRSLTEVAKGYGVLRPTLYSWMRRVLKHRDDVAQVLTHQFGLDDRDVAACLGNCVRGASSDASSADDAISRSAPMAQARDQQPRVFISYVHEDMEQVIRLCHELKAEGLDVWRDEERLRPGTRWGETIRNEIRDSDFFLACFSDSYATRDHTYMNEELTVACDRMRVSRRDLTWLLPVRLSECDVPAFPIGPGGETLRDLQFADLWDDWAGRVRRLLLALLPRRTERADSISRLPHPVVSHSRLTDLPGFSGCQHTVVGADGGVAIGEVHRDSFAPFETGHVGPSLGLGPKGCVVYSRDSFSRRIRELEELAGGGDIGAAEEANGLLVLYDVQGIEGPSLRVRVPARVQSILAPGTAVSVIGLRDRLLICRRSDGDRLLQEASRGYLQDEDAGSV